MRIPVRVKCSTCLRIAAGCARHPSPRSSIAVQHLVNFCIIGQQAMMRSLIRATLIAALMSPWGAMALHAQDAPPTPSDPVWAFEVSDIPVDPAFRFGVLENGMRYILRENATPAGTALVRLHIGSGSLDEEDHERGLAHFLGHMAFNGSTNVPDGEMENGRASWRAREDKYV